MTDEITATDLKTMHDNKETMEIEQLEKITEGNKVAKLEVTYDCFDRIVEEPEAVASVATSAVKQGITFKVEPKVEQGGRYQKNSVRMRETSRSDSLEEAWRKIQTNCTIEAMSPTPHGCVEVFTKQNLFAKAVHAAFYGHHPLVLSPDIIWITIAQGLANHVDQNVCHEGKKELVVNRPNFVKGSSANDWPGVFPEFSAQIKENSMPGTVELIESNFSTTGPVERIVSHITLMDVVQHYFTYTKCCGCGFPSITLLGTPDDWKKIREKATLLREYDLDWWIDELVPVLDHFVAAAEGRPDVEFWRSLCMINTGTSFPCYSPLTGWVQVFFPYLIEPGRGFDTFSEAKGVPKKQMRRNDGIANYMKSYKSKVNPENFGKERDTFDRFAPPPEGVGWGVKLENFPPAMSNAPFMYKDLATNKSHQMSFCGGVTCLVQHEDGAIEPMMGWAVLDSGLSESAESKLKGD